MQKTRVRGGSCPCSCPMGINICSVFGLARELVPVRSSSCCLCKVFSATIEPEIHRENTRTASSWSGSGTALSGGINFTAERTTTRKERKAKKKKRKGTSKNAPIAINFDQLRGWLDLTWVWGQLKWDSNACLIWKLVSGASLGDCESIKNT